jgi:hypothetical protein
MPLLVRQTLLMPLRLAQVFTWEKFFARNPIIADRRRNGPALAQPRQPLGVRSRLARRSRG